jgi:multimeric flavodoxin WrbA
MEVQGKNGTQQPYCKRLWRVLPHGGTTTELIHLYDLNYKGCISCFACKTIGGKSYGRCAVQEGRTME